MKLLVLLLLFAGSAALGADPDFNAYWRDGNAELDGYRLTVSRYGQERKGQGILIYVTEPFSESKRVKVDDPAKNPADTFDALKLNSVRDFQTGIYNYSTMASVFVRDTDFSPVKISFSSQEWCGNVYEELIFNPGKITGQYHSYFENESSARHLDYPAGGLTEDALWIVLRGLRGAFLNPGEKKTVPFLPGSFYGRLTHHPPAWTTADIERKGDEYTVKIADGRTGKFLIEAAYPHKIMRWELLPDVKAEFTGTLRVPYWRLHDNGQESYLKELGLKPAIE